MHRIEARNKIGNTTTRVETSHPYSHDLISDLFLILESLIRNQSQKTNISAYQYALQVIQAADEVYHSANHSRPPYAEPHQADDTDFSEE